MDTQVASELARFVAETKYSEIPEEVVKFAKGLVLKTVAGMLAGSIMPSGRKMSKIIKSQYLREEAGVIGCGFRTSLWESIFLNAFFAHTSELEDDSTGLGTFWDITVIPLLFPLGEKLRISGKNLMEALIVGLEVHARTCLFSPQQLNLVVVPGAVGPAAAGARALGLNIEKTASAFGLAMSGAAISLLNVGTDAHYLESALQSLHGMMAAEMAKEGMSGNPNIPSYLIGLLGKEKVDPEKIVMNLGKEWLMCDIGIKKYPCCLFTQRQIDLVLELKREYNLSFEDVEKIEVHVSPADALCDRPEPKSLGDLQFSFQHVLGAAMLDGDLNFTHIDVHMLADLRYKEACSKVEVVIHSDWSNIIMEAPAQLTIKMKDGKRFSRERMNMIGSRQEPLSMDQFSGLYCKYTSGILSDDKVEKTMRTLLNLEKLNDVGELMNMLTYV